MSIPEYIQNLSAYVAGKPIDEVAREYNLLPQNIIKLASNENPHGMSEMAIHAIQKYLSQNNLSEIARYPDANQFSLKNSISKKFNIDINWITCGNGSNDILELIARTLVNPKTDSIMYSQYSFAVYELTAQAMGAKAQVIKANDYAHDLHAMLKEINSTTSLIFIANPNNPTGTFIQSNELLEFIESVPKNIIIVLDEAYNEYLSLQIQYNSVEWVKKYPNLIVCRTFSKAYGLAALRIGYCIAHSQISELLNRVRQPFNVNSLALIAAESSLQDLEFLHKTCLSNKQGYAQITTKLNHLNIKYIPSYGNFIMMNSGKFTGKQLNQKLLQKGVIIRPLDSYNLTNFIRVSIGLHHENENFLQILQQIYV